MTLVSQNFAILFADVSGSTSLYETIGDKPAAKAIERVLAQIAAVVTACQGRVVKTIGDEVMAAFRSPGPAVEAAKAMQLRVDAMDPVQGVKFSIRIGLHYGPVLEDSIDVAKTGDYWGDGVNTAARLAALAKGGQILTSVATVEAVPEASRTGMRNLDSLSMKGKQNDVQVYEVLWKEADDATQLLGHHQSSSRVEAILKLRIGGRELEFPASAASISLGREKGCDVVVAEKTASRKHARIERRGLQYYLVDESSNGTFVTIDGDVEVLLRRDRVMLRGRGKVCFGMKAEKAVEALEFECL